MLRRPIGTAAKGSSNPSGLDADQCSRRKGFKFSQNSLSFHRSLTSTGAHWIHVVDRAGNSSFPPCRCRSARSALGFRHTFSLHSKSACACFSSVLHDSLTTNASCNRAGDLARCGLCPRRQGKPLLRWRRTVAWASTTFARRYSTLPRTTPHCLCLAKIGGGGQFLCTPSSPLGLVGTMQQRHH